MFKLVSSGISYTKDGHHQSIKIEIEIYNEWKLPKSCFRNIGYSREKLES